MQKVRLLHKQSLFLFLIIVRRRLSADEGGPKPDDMTRVSSVQFAHENKASLATH